MPVAALQNALSLTYNLDELRLLAATGLGAEPESIWGDGATVGEAARELVAWARRHDRLCDLATAAAQGRPQNDALQAVKRLMPLVCAGGQRRVGTPQGETERQGQVADYPGENGVREAIGRYGAQIETLIEQITSLRAEIAQVRVAQEAQRAEAARRAATQRAQLWLLVVAVAGMLTTAGALAAHAWGG